MNAVIWALTSDTFAACVLACAAVTVVAVGVRWRRGS